MNVLTVEVQKHIHRPIDVVSQQFADMRHHSFDHVHPDIDFTVFVQTTNFWRVQQKVKLLGMQQVDIFEQERRADGALTAEVVEGTNKGMRLLQTFKADGADDTTVTIRVEVPVTGIKLWLKPLFAMAVRRTVAKGLEEDRIDLEEKGYQPH
jgi:hypothetical protein